MEHCIVWLRDLDTNKIGAEVFKSFEMWFWRRMEKIKWSQIFINKEILDTSK